MSLKSPLFANLPELELQVHKGSPRPLSNALTRAAADFNERLFVSNLMEQLSHLCRGVQRHRGFSMGILAGNESFVADFNDLQQQMSRRVQMLTAFADRSPMLFSRTDIERLHYAWGTIRDNWQGDSVLENFEFHSHFVDQLLLLMARLAERIGQPYYQQIGAIVDSPKLSRLAEPNLYQQLLTFSSRQLPRFIEMLGKVRALSVHMAATGRSESGYGKRLNYLLQCVSQEKGAVFEATNSLHHNLIEQLPVLLTIKTYEYKLDYLLDKVHNDIIGSVVIPIREEEIFDMATEIIDIYWKIVDNSFNLLTRWQQDDLEQWLLEG